jgi:hypothetical protein
MGWVYALQDMNNDQLRQGVDNLQYRADNHWPPNAQEFAELCKTSYTWERQCHKQIDTSHMIENTTAKEKRIADGLNAIRALREQVGL